MFYYWVLSTVQNGYRIQFRRQPPPFLGVHRTVVKKSPGTNFIRRDCHPSKKEGNFSAKAQRKLTGLYSIISLCPIKDGVLRPILKRRHLNAYIKVLWFKMLTTAQILETIEPNDWFTTIDAYFHVPLHSDHKKFLLFAFQSQAYQFEVLTFGLSLLPRVFTSLHMAGINILPYLDDWLISAPSRHRVLEDTEKVINHIKELVFA